MITAIELLRNVAGLMFWSLADFFLGFCWIGIIVGIIVGLIRGAKHDD